MILALASGLTGGCTELTGGAVELSWEVRTFAGGRTECDVVDVEQIRVLWRRADAGSETPDGFEDFDCDTSHGLTGFDIAEGDGLVWLELLCAGGDSADPASYDTPPPILRAFSPGSVATLNSQLVVVRTSCPGSTLPCTCQ